jgi:hypothetical protein
MFQLNDDEWPSLISQNKTSKKGRGGRRKIFFVFTEHEILMLSSVLNSDRAIQINIQLVHIFTRLRQMFNSQNRWIGLKPFILKQACLFCGGCCPLR